MVEVPITLATEITSCFLFRESDYIRNQDVLENIIGCMYMTKIIIFNNSIGKNSDVEMSIYTSLGDNTET